MHASKFSSGGLEYKGSMGLTRASSKVSQEETGWQCLPLLHATPYHLCLGALKEKFVPNLQAGSLVREFGGNFGWEGSPHKPMKPYSSHSATHTSEAWDKALHWEKKEKKSPWTSREVVWDGERVPQPVPNPKPLLGSRRSPVFFLFDPIFCIFSPHCGAWSKANTSEAFSYLVPGCKESQFYSLPVGPAVARMY